MPWESLSAPTRHPEPLFKGSGFDGHGPDKFGLVKPGLDKPGLDKPGDSEPCLQIRLSDRRILNCSPAFRERTGWAPGELENRPCTAVFAESAHAALHGGMDQAVLMGRFEQVEAELLKACGHPLRGAMVLTFEPRAGDRLSLSFAWSTDGQRPVSQVGAHAGPTVEPPPTAGVEAGRTATTIMQALGAVGAAALEVGEDGRITDVTPALDQVLGQGSHNLRRLRIEEVFLMSEQAQAAFRQAREEGLAQSVLARGGPNQSQLVVEWLTGTPAGAGYALVTGPAEDEVGTERLRMQSQLVSLVAHDVRNSLAAVKHGLEMLAEDLPADSPLQNIVGQALRENERASRISQDVLWASRPGDLNRVEIDIDALIQGSAERFEHRRAQQAIRMHLQLGSGATILADLSSLERGLCNLIENAFDAMPGGGEVRITTANEARGRAGVRISIRDTGMGIKHETQPLVYEYLFTDKLGGTGLGLAIARRVVLDHQGQIDFESLEDEGTHFYLWLPALTH